METVDLRKLQITYGFLASFIDRLVEQDDLEPDLEFESRPREVEIDGLTPHKNYCRNCECCEGMDW